MIDRLIIEMMYSSNKLTATAFGSDCALGLAHACVLSLLPLPLRLLSYLRGFSIVNQVCLLQPTHADIVIEGSRGLDQLAVYRVTMGVSSFARKGHSR
jgi:hypothetical protein